MENLRWILILAGVAILLLLYFSGRPRKVSDRRLRGMNSELDNLDGIGRGGYDMPDDVDPLMGDQPMHDQYSALGEVHPDDMIRPGQGRPSQTHPAQIRPEHAHPGQARASAGSSSGQSGEFYPDSSRPYAPRADVPRTPTSRSSAAQPSVSPLDSTYPPSDYDFDDLDSPTRKNAVPGFSTLAQKFEAFSERLSPRRRQRIAESEPDNLDDGSAENAEGTNKIITLHVVAQPNNVLPGEHLLDLFERRGYHYGELSIFHSMHEGVTVFSVAKMIEPGSFDINDIASFETPGITLILQLPGPVPADVSFEVLVSEAFEMANELGATVLDEQHSTLTKQTVQHLREGIYEYMHRQKYFGTVPS